MPSKFSVHRTESLKPHAPGHIFPVHLAVLALGTVLLSLALLGPGIPGLSKQLGGWGCKARGGGIQMLGSVGGGWKRAVRMSINYADRCCENSQPRNCASMLEHGAHRCIPHNATSLDEDFKARNAKVLQQKRGAGYWLWKPYIILKTLLYEMEEGDLLLYSDAGAIAIGDLRPLYELAVDQDIVLFQGDPKWHHKERQWTKPEVFTLMGCPVEECGKNLQIQASFSVWKKSFRTIQFVSQWLSYMEDPRVSTDSPSTLSANTTGFAEHRHDQSCVGLLAHRWRLTPANYSYIELAFDHNRDRS